MKSNNRRLLLRQLVAVGAMLSTLLSPSFLQSGASTEKLTPQETGRKYNGPPFRYIIAYESSMIGGAGKDLTILMEPEDFSEMNLRILFKLLMQRYPQAKELNANVETSLQDIATPEERDKPKSSEEPANPNAMLHPSATIRHRMEGDSLHMFVPSRRGAKNSATPIDLRIPSSR